MPETQGITGFTTDVQMLIDATFQSILEPKDITGPAITPEFADFTHQQSPRGFRERKPTVKSSGQVSFKTNYVSGDATHQALIAAARAVPSTLCEFKEIYPDDSGFYFKAYVGLQWGSPMTNPLEMTVTLDIAGDITPLDELTT
jgi:hypothetical protein